MRLCLLDDRCQLAGGDVTTAGCGGGRGNTDVNFDVPVWRGGLSPVVPKHEYGIMSAKFIETAIHVPCSKVPVVRVVVVVHAAVVVI